MPTTNAGGIDVRQTGTALVFRALLQDSSGVIVTTGTTSLRLYELQADGTLLSYDFNSNTFKTTALTTETASMTHRTGNNSTVNTGIWTYALNTVSGFSTKSVYFARVDNSGASPIQQVREFQYGSGQGDEVVSTSGLVSANVGAFLGTAVTEGAGGRLAGAISTYGNVATPTFTAASVNQTGDVYGISVVASGTVQAVSSTTVTLQTALGYNNRSRLQTIVITSGTGIGQSRRCTGYVNSTKIQTVDIAWDTNPAIGDSYVILAIGSPALTGNNHALVDLRTISGSNVTATSGIMAVNTTQWAGQATAVDGTNTPNVALTTAEHTALRTDLQTALTDQGYTAARAGYLDTLNGLVAAIWASATRTLTAFGFTVSTNANSTETAIKAQTDKMLFDVSNNIKSTPQTSVTVGTNNDKTGYALTAGEHTAIQTDVTTGLTAQGYTSARGPKLDNLDATVSSRMASYTQPTGFLAATFPATVASTTNITAGTITTVTNLTNAPTAGDLTATMKASVTTAATAATPTVSVDTAAIAQEVVDQLGTPELTFISNFTSNGKSLRIVLGDSYTATNSNQLKFNITNLSAAVGTQAHLYLPGVGDVAQSSTITQATQEVVFSDIAASALTSMVASDQLQRYTIVFVTSGGLKATKVEGYVTVVSQVS